MPGLNPTINKDKIILDAQLGRRLVFNNKIATWQEMRLQCFKKQKKTDQKKEEVRKNKEAKKSKAIKEQKGRIKKDKKVKGI